MNFRSLRMIAVAMVAGLLLSVSAAVPAHADTLCDTTCIYNQLISHQIPARPTDGPRQYGPLGLWLYYTGPNGLEIRVGHDMTWTIISVVAGLETAGISLEVTGAAMGAGELIATQATPDKLQNAATLIGMPVSSSLSLIASHMKEFDLCLAMTIPGGSLSAALTRAQQLFNLQLYNALSPLSPSDVKVWFEDCSLNRTSTGLSDLASPATLGLTAQTFHQAERAMTLPQTGNAIDDQILRTADSAVYAKTGVSYGGWSQEAVGGNATQVAAGGGVQMFLRNDSAVFARYTNGTGDGVWVQETDPGTASAIAVSSTGLQMIIAGDASIWSKKGVTYGGWSQEVGPGNAAAIAVGGDTEMFKRGDSAVFAKTYGAPGWTQETNPATASAIAVSSTGVQMMIAGDASVYAKTGIGFGGWTQEVGPGNAAAIAVGGNTQLFLRGDNAVFAKTTIGANGWTQETDPNTAVAIAVSANGTQMLKRSDSSAWAKSGVAYGGWSQETDPGTVVSMAASG